MIQDFKDAHKGETALVIGNGPSLDDTPLEALGKLYPTFGANKIYNYPYKPTYYACVDRDMFHDCVPWLMAHTEYRPAIFLPREIPFPGSHGLNVTVNSPFSIDAQDFVTLGGTVTFVNLQLAYYMGFTTVLLVGVDHRYPDMNGGAPGSKFIAAGGDKSHFRGAEDVDYFEAGRVYNRPELTATGARVYPAARQMYERAGRRIINLTPGTALEAFQKDTFAHWLKEVQYAAQEG